MRVSLRFQLVVSLAVLTLGAFAFAQDQFADPPDRVARLQYLEGQVSLQPAGEDEWIDAGMNRPLTTADRLWSDRGARAELTIGTAALRIGGESSLTLTDLTDNTAQFELDQGELSLSVRELGDGEVVEVDTPSVAFTALEPGEYRIDVRPDTGETSIQVRSGDGQASGPDTSIELAPGQRYLFHGGQSLEYTVADVTPPGRFDQWCEQRESAEIASPSLQYVSPEVVGYAALDGNGDWDQSPVYGAVWFPHVHPGWAPYREGHWAWVEPWGWTWVDEAPWGFAPFHYGRWVNDRGRWGWVPGPRRERAVYAPALVAWIGGGPDFGVSLGISGGGVGWVALGWHDPYIPSYHVSAEYARRVNISNSRVVNVSVINNYYTTNDASARERTVHGIQFENARVTGAMTAVPNAAFISGRPVAQAAVVVPATAAAHVSFGASASVAPTREALFGGHAPAAAPKLAAPRQVIARTPPPPPPVSFEQQKTLLQKSGGVPLSPSAKATLRATSPAAAARGGRPAVVTATKAPAAPAASRPPAAGQAPPGAHAAPSAPARAPASAPAPTPVPAGRPQGQPPAAPSGQPSARPTAPANPPAGGGWPQGEHPANQAPSAQRPSPSAPAPAPAGRPQGQPPAVPSGQPSARPTAPANPPAGGGWPQGEHPANQAPSAQRPSPSAPAPAPAGRPQGQPPATPSAQPSARPTAPANPPAGGGGPQGERPANQAPSAQRPSPSAPAPAPATRPQGQPPAGKAMAPEPEKGAPPAKDHQQKGEKEKEPKSNE